MARYGTGARLSSDQEQEKLRAYRQAGLGGQDSSDVTTLEDQRFQQWDGSGFQGLNAVAGGAPAGPAALLGMPPSMTALGAATGAPMPAMSAPGATPGASTSVGVSSVAAMGMPESQPRQSIQVMNGQLRNLGRRSPSITNLDALAGYGKRAY